MNTPLHQPILNEEAQALLGNLYRKLYNKEFRQSFRREPKRYLEELGFKALIADREIHLIEVANEQALTKMPASTENILYMPLFSEDSIGHLQEAELDEVTGGGLSSKVVLTATMVAYLIVGHLTAGPAEQKEL